MSAERNSGLAIGFGVAGLAVALAALSLAQGDAGVAPTLFLALASLAAAALPGAYQGRALTWVWTLGVPPILVMTEGLGRPHVLLVTVGPLVALALVRRRLAVLTGALGLGGTLALFTAQLNLGRESAGLVLEEEVDAVLGLSVSLAVLVLAYNAAAARSAVSLGLRARNRLAEHWLRGLPDTLIRIDDHGTVLDALERPPFDGQLVAGRPLVESFPELRGLMSTLARGRSQHGIERVEVRAGTRGRQTLEVRAIRTEPGIVLIVRDVTEREEADRLDREAERQRGQVASETQVLQAGRLAQMGVLACGVAHEINNPLAYVLTNLQFIETGLDAQENASALKEAIGDALEGAYRIRSIVEDIRTFAKAEDSDQIEILQLADAARSAVRLLRFELRERVHLIEKLEPTPPVFANPSRLTQIVVNLLVNAVQAIPPERGTLGTVTLSTGTDVETGEAYVEVVDDGVGIPEENRKRVFEPFFTTRPIGQGTGLGLAICYGLVRRLGGSVQVQSSVGVGSTFRVRLPDGQPLLNA